METLTSVIIKQEGNFSEYQKRLLNLQFSLGGNWDYDHGCFDYALDEEQKVWLRLPFEVVQGQLDSEQENVDAMIRFGQPYVLKHLYNEGTDPEADIMTIGGLVNQFQDPIDADAKVESEWVEKSKTILKKVEEII